MAYQLLTLDGMMDVTLSILALIAGGVTLELFTAPRAQVAHPDERASSDCSLAEDFPTGNPS